MTTGYGPQGTVYATAGAFTYNVPADRSLVYVTLQAAGGGGNGCGAGPFNTGGGGGGTGELCVRVPYVVTPGGTVAGSVGAGGIAGVAPEGFGGTGGDSVFGTLRARGAPQVASAMPFNSGNDGGGVHAPGTGFDGSVGALDAPIWFAGAGGGNHAAGGPSAMRIGGQAGGRYGANTGYVNVSRDGGAGAASVFADGVDGAPVGNNGTQGTRGGGGSGGGGSSSLGGTGGDGYVIVEYS